MNASFVLEHVEIGAFIKINYDAGSAYGTLIAMCDDALAMRLPEAEGSTIAVINLDKIESIAQGATARGMYQICTQHRAHAEARAAIELASQQMKVEGEHA